MRNNNLSLVVRNFSHNSTTASSEPTWSGVEKTKLPRQAFADMGEADQKSSWSYPHHFVENGGGENDMGTYTTGTMYLHEGGLNAAWAAANGARSGEEASAAVKSHLQDHRRALGLDTEENRASAHRKPTEGKPWYAIHNQADESESGPVEINIYDDIGESFWGSGISAKQFVEDLKPYRTRDLTVRINSPGGSVSDGLVIYNTLTRHQGRVDCVVDGFACSTASFIAMAGDSLAMPENAMLMIHDPWSFAIGNAAEMMKQADTLRKIGNNMVDIYAKNSSLSKAKITDMMAQETWITADDAKKYGFCQQVLPGQRVAAHFDFSRFKNVPQSVMENRPNFNHAKGIVARLHERAAQLKRGA